MAGLLPSLALAQAAPWPTRPVRFVVPYAPGGPVELPARSIAEHLSPRLGQPVVVELKPGAAGGIGAREVVGSTDGHSFLFCVGGLAPLPALQRDPGFDLLRDLKPVSLVADTPMAIAVRADSPIRDLQDLVRRGREDRGSVSYGSSGNGATTHLAWLLLEQLSGGAFLHVPYRGAGPALNGLYTGEIAAFMVDLALLLPHARSGQFRLLAVTSPGRLSLLPGVPAVAEAVPGYALPIWTCILGPRRVPDAVVARLVAEMEPLRQGSPLAMRIAEAGGDLLLTGPEPLDTRLRAEVAQWRDVLSRAGIAPE